MIQNEVTLGFSGASGAIYGWKLLQALAQTDLNISVVMSTAGTMVFKDEVDNALPGSVARMHEYFIEKLDINSERIKVYGKDQWYAPLASGSGAPSQMVVCPCSVGYLSAVATGQSNNLMERAADVVLKERGKLVLVVREMPLSAIHLQHMLTLTQMGAVIMPASPGFYFNPKTLEEVVDFVVARILDQLQVAQNLLPKWGRV